MDRNPSLHWIPIPSRLEQERHGVNIQEHLILSKRVQVMNKANHMEAATIKQVHMFPRIFFFRTTRQPIWSTSKGSKLQSLKVSPVFGEIRQIAH